MDKASQWYIVSIMDPPLDVNNAFDRLLFDLESISLIKCGEKICTTSEYLTSNPRSVYMSLKRTIVGESREKDFLHLNNIINLAVELSNCMKESKYLCIYELNRVVTLDDESNYNSRIKKLCRMQTSLRKSIHGIINFKKSYPDDRQMEKKADLLIENTKNHVNELENYLNSLTEKKMLYIASNNNNAKSTEFDEFSNTSTSPSNKIPPIDLIDS